MNTTPTTKAKPTAGPWDVSKTSPTDVCSAMGTIVKNVGPNVEKRIGEQKANANLIAEAGTVYHETNLTPRELVEQKKQLRESLERIVNWYDQVQHWLKVPSEGSDAIKWRIDFAKEALKSTE